MKNAERLIIIKEYDIAAFIWPSYTGDEPRAKIFWPEGIGEWQTVRDAKPKYDGHQWPRKPLWGYVNEADPEVMEKQIECATQHGVNVFIYDWYWYDKRPFLEQCLNNGFLKAKNNKDMKFYLMWSNHNAPCVWDKRLSDDETLPDVWDAACDRAEFEIIANRMIEKYFKRDNYYKIEGKPVLMIYYLQNLLTGLGGVEGVVDAFNWFREQVKKAGFPGLHLQAVKRAEDAVFNVSGVDGNQPVNQTEIILQMGFDSITNYQFVHITDVKKDYMEVLSDVEKIWEQMDELPIDYYPHVSVGWDNNPRYNSLRPIITENSCPENFENGLIKAKEYIDSHKLPVPLITINSWNEWTECSYLEPDDVNGYGFLEAIKKVFKK